MLEFSDSIKRLENPLNIHVNGYVAHGFEAAKSSFENLWLDIEVGASFSVYHRGEPVIDLWGGYGDKKETIPWQQNTLVNVYSATKGLAAIAFATLVEEEKVSYEDLVTKHWPEFGQEGKDEVTVAQLLSHQAGVCGVDETLVIEDLYNQDKIATLLARQKPYWPPGTASGYHAVTWGYLVAELVKRITGQTLGQYFRDKIAVPLKLNTFIGLPDEHHANCADLVGPNHARRLPSGAKPQNNPPEKPSDLFQTALMNPPISPFKHACSPAWRRAEIPASNGHSDASSLAKLYGLLASKPNSILSEATLVKALKVEVGIEKDLVTNSVIRRSRGFILAHEGNYGPTTNSFGHAGAGGSMAFADPDAEVGFAYVMNQMQPDSQEPSRSNQLARSVYACISALNS